MFIINQVEPTTQLSKLPNSYTTNRKRKEKMEAEQFEEGYKKLLE